MKGIFSGKMKMRIPHYLCKVKCNDCKGVICSSDDTLTFISDDQHYEKSIAYERIKKIDDLDGYEKLGNMLIYLIIPLLALIAMYYESVGLSRLYVQAGFFFLMVIGVVGLYLFTRFGLLIRHRDNNGNMITTKFTGSKLEIHVLSKVILSEITKIVDEHNLSLIEVAE